MREPYPITITPHAIRAYGGNVRVSVQGISDQLAADARQAYERREAEIGAETLRGLEHRIVLQLLDHGWREHLQAMQDLLTGIAMRSPDGKASLHDYRREGAELFARMREEVRRKIVRTLFY